MLIKYLIRETRGSESERDRKEGAEERKLQWFGHVEMRSQEYVGKRVRDLEVRGRRKIQAESEIHLDLVLKQDLKDKNLDVNKESRKEAKE